MIKYFCDMCEKELKKEGVKVYHDDRNFDNLELCKDCYKVYQKCEKDIDEIHKKIYKQAFKDYAKAREEILNKAKKNDKK